MNLAGKNVEPISPETAKVAVVNIEGFAIRLPRKSLFLKAMEGF